MDLVQEIPVMNNCEDLMQAVQGMPECPCFAMDMPRAIAKDKLYSLYAGLECVKNGLTYDKRYNFEKRRMTRPVQLVFAKRSALVPAPAFALNVILTLIEGVY